jgi:hypothetical protein
MEDQRVLHYFISTVNNFSSSQAAPQVQPVIETVVDPLTTNYGQPENQLNILTEIARTEAEETSLELEPNLDLSGFNHALAINDSNLDELTNEAEESVLEVEAEETYDRNITIDEVITYTDPVGNTFEVPSLGITPADLEMIEAMESSEGTPIEADLDSVPTDTDDFDLDFSQVEDEDDDSSFEF